MIIHGVVHLKALPGSPSNSLGLDEITKLAQKDVENLYTAGVDGIIIENFGDVPFVKNDISKRTLASFTSVVQKLEINSDLKVGINVLRNDGIAALSIAEATNSDFVRINVLNNVMMFTDQGIIEGEAHEISDFKKNLNNDIEIYADVFVKHAVPPEGSKIENHAEELINRAPKDCIFDPPHSTLSIGGISGGIAHNVIADKCKVEWETRPVVKEDGIFVTDQIDKFVSEELLPQMKKIFPNSNIRKETIGEVIGFNRIKDSEACELVSSITGDNSREVVSFGTEAGLFQEIGISTVVCGPGSIEQAHKIDEFIELNELKKCLTFLEGIKNKSIN